MGGAGRRSRAPRSAAPRLRASAALLLVAALAAGARAADDEGAWRHLERLRGELAAAGPLAAEFTQSYVPAGFESGDSESGTLAARLPDCLRWDYAPPEAKSFLVCGARAWSWVPGEPRGQRIAIDAAGERGLDLLLLPAAELARRYRASAHPTGDGGVELAFEPRASGSELLAANLTLEPGGSRPAALDWRDREGNVSSFRFRSWRPLAETDLFSPPAGVDWSR
jgi:hypothetical protein